MSTPALAGRMASWTRASMCASRSDGEARIEFTAWTPGRRPAAAQAGAGDAPQDGEVRRPLRDLALGGRPVLCQRRRGQALPLAVAVGVKSEVAAVARRLQQRHRDVAGAGLLRGGLEEGAQRLEALRRFRRLARGAADGGGGAAGRGAPPDGG